MRPEHDPMRLVAQEHLRRHLVEILDAVDMPEAIRTATVDTLLAAGDVHCEDRPEIVTVDGKPSAMLVHHSALTIRHPVPDRIENTEATR